MGSLWHCLCLAVVAALACTAPEPGEALGALPPVTAPPAPGEEDETDHCFGGKRQQPVRGAGAGTEA